MMASVKRHILWIAAALALVATPVVIGVVVLSDGDDRRLGAVGTSPASVSHVRLSIGETQTNWRSFSWGADLDVTEYRSAEETGDTLTRLVPGKSKLRAITLERGFTVGGDTASLIQSLRGGERFKEATVQVLDSTASLIATYGLSGVLVASIDHELVAGNPFLERLSLRYEDVAFS